MKFISFYEVGGQFGGEFFRVSQSTPICLNISKQNIIFSEKNIIGSVLPINPLHFFGWIEKLTIPYMTIPKTHD